MPKYSLIVPVYNVENYIENCINSILVQDYKDYEVIIVDDGSIDASGYKADKIAKLNSEKVKVIHQKNKGLGGARNSGLMKASGEYVWFIDSDDTIANNALKEIDDFIVKHKVDLVVFDYLYVDEKGKKLSREVGFSKPGTISTLEETPEMLFMANSACNKVYRKDLFEMTGVLFPEHKWFEDLCTVVKLYPFAKKIGYLDKELYFYLQRSGSIMKNKNIERNYEIIDVFTSLISYFEKINLYSKYYNEIEYLAIIHVYLLASVRVLKVDSNNRLLKEFKNYLEEKFPEYKNNQYYNSMSKKNKLILALLDKEKYFLLKVLFKINSKLK